MKSHEFITLLTELNDLQAALIFAEAHRTGLITDEQYKKYLEAMIDIVTDRAKIGDAVMKNDLAEKQTAVEDMEKQEEEHAGEE